MVMSRPDPSPALLFGQPAARTVAPVALAVSALFIAFPGIDLAVAGFFHTGGNGFVLRDGAIHRFVDDWIRPHVKDLVIVMLALACVSLASGGRIMRWRPRSIAFIALNFALGPGLLVNGLLKNSIGRARPKHLEMLGGDKLFSAAFAPAEQCASNCSFVSGDVAFIAAGLGFALLLEGTKRKIAVFICLVLTGLAGYYRMAVGAHFASDVLLATLFCFIITLALHQLMFFRPSGAPTRS
jgi:lipid A 4'-phosphatase